MARKRQMVEIQVQPQKRKSRLRGCGCALIIIVVLIVIGAAGRGRRATATPTRTARSTDVPTVVAAIEHPPVTGVPTVSPATTDIAPAATARQIINTNTPRGTVGSIYGTSTALIEAYMGQTAAAQAVVAVNSPVTLNEATIVNAQPTQDALQVAIEDIEGVNRATRVTVLPMNQGGYIVDVEALVGGGYVTLSTAQMMMLVAGRDLDVQEFFAILDDEQGNAVSYSWRPRDGWNETRLSFVQPISTSAQPTNTSVPTRTPQPTVTAPPPSPAFVCPRNCDEARAWGVSAEQAAQCGLDRDNDGMACYGD